MSTILFQGDSITDCGRDYRNAIDLGRGYPLLVASELGAKSPKDYAFYNRGISGNRIVDVYSRIKADIINLEPDYMSLLIGINDLWHELVYRNGVDTRKFEKIYEMLLSEVLEALPAIKIVLLAPYVLKGRDTCETEASPGRWEAFRSGVDERIAVVKRLGEKFKLPVIELQSIFDDAEARTGNAAHWTADGVHPTPYGHRLIADAWLQEWNEAIEKSTVKLK